MIFSNTSRGRSCEGRILGDDCFTDEILVKVHQKRAREYTLDQVIDAVCARFGISLEQLKAPGKVRPMTEARAVIAVIVQASSHLKLTSLANELNRDLSALCKAAQRAIADERLTLLSKEVVAQFQSKD